MKNLFFYFFGLVAFFCLMGCSDDDIVASKDSSSVTDDSHQGEYLYLNLNLGSASQGDTRADLFETNKGFPHENTVKKGRIYVFFGTDENDAVCVSYGEIDMAKSDTLILDNNQFSRGLRLRNIKLNYFSYLPDKTYFALAILNANDDFVFPNNENNQKFSDWAKPALGYTSNMLIEDGTYINPDIPESTKQYKRYFPTMTNATGQTGYVSTMTFKPTTLVKIDPRDISKSEFPESYQPYTTIYVQRNVARVLVQPRLNNNGGNSLVYEDKKVGIGNPDNPDEYWEAEVNMANWCLDVTNTKTYPVMKIDDVPYHRKNSNQEQFFHIGDTEFERVNWAKDPNYNIKFPSQDNFTRAKLGNDAWTDIRNPLYCLENTFNPDCMLQGQTTRIIIRGRWACEEIHKNTGELFGSLPGGPTGDCFNSINALNNPGGGPNSNKVGFYMTSKGDKVWCRTHIEKALEEKAQEIYGEGTSLIFSWHRYTSGGYLTLNQLFDKIEITTVDGSLKSTRPLTTEDYNQLAPAVDLKDATTDKMSYYFNCVMFYTLRIPHFKESDVPWDKFNEITTKNDGTRIAAYQDKHLGRYGVVRNNSYVISVTSIHRMGTPTIPDIINDDTDDMPEPLLMNVDVKVQSWAKHDISFSF